MTHFLFCICSVPNVEESLQRCVWQLQRDYLVTGVADLAVGGHIFRLEACKRHRNVSVARLQHVDTYLTRVGTLCVCERERCY